jgi:hypothetical protein
MTSAALLCPDADRCGQVSRRQLQYCGTTHRLRMTRTHKPTPCYARTLHRQTPYFGISLCYRCAASWPGVQLCRNGFGQRIRAAGRCVLGLYSENVQGINASKQTGYEDERGG